ncbi:MAG: LysM peptidoglycan-binding domain-containing protein [Acidithiobacillales bacterium]
MKTLRHGGPVALLLAGAGLAGCSGTPAAVTASAPATVPQTSAPPPPSAREVATEHFRRGKALALAGDADCARFEFWEAIEAFRKESHPDETDDAAFAEQLWQGVVFYDDLGAGEAAERPPVEDTGDTLLAGENAPSPSPDQLEKATREVSSAVPVTSFDIPVVVNDAVLRAVAYFQFRTPKAFAGALKRSGLYLPMMRRILREEGLPQDLVYMAMIESAFKSGAHSRARAHGFWQFIDGTARRYGLRRNRYLDERSDPEKSTRAAARYLKDLYEMFGDWYLAMAAYSAGEGKVLKGLQLLGAEDYWQLSAGTFLRRETREYVPFVLAAALISKNPLDYGFDVVPDPPLRFEVVHVHRPVDLAAVAGALGAPLSELQLLNSELRTRATPHGLSDYAVRVPDGTAERLASRLASLPAPAAVAERRIKVRRGDTLAKVARRTGVPVQELCDLNDLPHSARLRKGQVLVVPAGPAHRRRSEATPRLASAAPRYEGEIRALPTPEAAVTRVEDLPPFTAAAVGGAAAPLPAHVEIPARGFETDAAPRLEPEAKTVRYTVRRGDTLYRIAARFGLTVEAICRENGLRAAKTLRAGSRLSLTIPLALAR